MPQENQRVIWTHWNPVKEKKEREKKKKFIVHHLEQAEKLTQTKTHASCAFGFCVQGSSSPLGPADGWMAWKQWANADLGFRSLGVCRRARGLFGLGTREAVRLVVLPES